MAKTKCCHHDLSFKLIDIRGEKTATSLIHVTRLKLSSAASIRRPSVRPTGSRIGHGGTHKTGNTGERVFLLFGRCLHSLASSSQKQVIFNLRANRCLGCTIGRKVAPCSILMLCVRRMVRSQRHKGTVEAQTHPARGSPSHIGAKLSRND